MAPVKTGRKDLVFKRDCCNGALVVELSSRYRGKWNLEPEKGRNQKGKTTRRFIRTRGILLKSGTDLRDPGERRRN